MLYTSSVCNRFPLFLSDFPLVLLRNLRHPVYLLVVLAQVNLSAMVAGLATFMGKFLERQFSLTASLANMIIGKHCCQGLPAFEHLKENNLHVTKKHLFLWSCQSPSITYRQTWHKVLAHMISQLLLTFLPLRCSLSLLG